MKFIKTKIEDLIIIEPTVFGDKWGYFLESYNQNKFEEIIGKVLFVQDNQSKSSKEYFADKNIIYPIGKGDMSLYDKSKWTVVICYPLI